MWRLMDILKLALCVLLTGVLKLQKGRWRDGSGVRPELTLVSAQHIHSKQAGLLLTAMVPVPSEERQGD